MDFQFPSPIQVAVEGAGSWTGGELAQEHALAKASSNPSLFGAHLLPFPVPWQQPPPLWAAWQAVVASCSFGPLTDGFLSFQDFCHGQVMWPPLSALQVKLAEPGQSCKQVCQENQLICEPSFFQHLNKDKDLLK